MCPEYSGAEPEQPSQEGGLVHPLHRQNVPTDIWLDQRLGDVCAPSALLRNERGASRVTAEINVTLEIEAERCRHFGERPMHEADGLVPAGKALAQPLLHEQRSGTKQNDLHGPLKPSIRIPLSHVRPLDAAFMRRGSIWCSWIGSKSLARNRSPAAKTGSSDPVPLTSCPYAVFRPSRTSRGYPRIAFVSLNMPL